MFGLSRLGYSLALNRQVPSLLGRLHPRYNTPFVLIGLGGLLAAGLVLPADLELLAAIYAFGATLAFLLVHLSVGRLRGREPDRDRPFKMPFNVRALGVEWPLTALLGRGHVGRRVRVGAGAARRGALGRAWAGWGPAWRCTWPTASSRASRSSSGSPSPPGRSRGTRSRRSSTRSWCRSWARRSTTTSCRPRGASRARRTRTSSGAGAVIEALWVFEVPMSLPLDARVADADLRRARQALARAKAVGEEYEGVEVATATVRARRAGEAIVHEARRRGVEAIVLAAEEPTAIRGGLRLGGKQGLHDSFVGETTRYVLLKAPCRVILTAPPSAAHVDPTLVDGDTGADQPLGHPLAHDGGAGSPR